MNQAEISPRILIPASPPPARFQSSIRVLAGAALLLGGCAEGRVEMGEAVTTHDRDGVQVLEIDRDRLPPPAGVGEPGGVEPDPLLLVGEGPEAHLQIPLFRVTRVLPTGDNRMAFANMGTLEIFLVDREGGEVTRIGGRGSGPGEFQIFAGLFLEPDGGVGVHDLPRNRYVVLGEDGSELRSVPLPPPAGSGVPTLVHAGDGRAFRFLDGGFPPHLSPSFRNEQPLVQVIPAGDTLAWILGSEVFRSEEGVGAVFHGKRTVVAGSATGAWVGDSAEPRVVHFRDAGGPDRIVEWRSSGPRAVEDADREALVETLLHREGIEGAERLAAQDLMDQIHSATERPWFDALLEADDGALWIGEPHPPHLVLARPHALEQEWMVVEPGGRGAHLLRLPAGFRLTAVSGDELFGVQVDALGVESVRIYRWTARR